MQLLCMSEYMWESMRIPIFAGVTAIGLAFLVVAIICLRHVRFRRKCDRVYNGMAKVDVFKIMGDPYDCTIDYDGSELYHWLKPQWKGWFRGGAVVRSLTVTIKDNKVIKIVRKNMDVSVL